MELIYTPAIFCGGNSRRMGQDKALIPLYNETLLSRLASAFSECGTILLSVGEKENVYSIPNTMEVKDRIKACGPLGGLYSVFCSTDAEWIFAVACDMPFMDPSFPAHLLSLYGSRIQTGSDRNEDSVQAIIPRDASGIHPLAGFYHRSILPLLKKQLQEENYKMMNLLKNTNVIYADTDSFPDRLKKSLINMNTPGDYASLFSHIPAICGYHNSGKTTLICNLISCFNKQGLLTSVIKHTHHDYEEIYSNPVSKGSDSAKTVDTDAYLSAGAVRSVLIGPDHLDGIPAQKPTLGDALLLLPFCDIILLEGFKNSRQPAIWIADEENSLQNCPIPPERLAAIVLPCKKDRMQPYASDPVFSSLTLFSRDDVEEIANFIKKKFIYF